MLGALDDGRANPRLLYSVQNLIDTIAKSRGVRLSKVANREGREKHDALFVLGVLHFPRMPCRLLMEHEGRECRFGNSSTRDERGRKGSLALFTAATEKCLGVCNNLAKQQAFFLPVSANHLNAGGANLTQ